MNRILGWRVPIILVAAGVCLLVVGVRGLIIGLLPAKDLSDPGLDWGTLHANQHVTIDNVYTDGYYYYYSEDGADTARRYALIDVENIEGQDYMFYFMGINAKKDEFAKFDKISEQMVDWEYGDETTPLPTDIYIGRDGFLSKMDKDEVEALKDWVRELGWSEEDVNDAVIPYVVMENQTNTTNILMAIGGLVALVAGAALGIVSFKNSRM